MTSLCGPAAIPEPEGQVPQTMPIFGWSANMRKKPVAFFFSLHFPHHEKPYTKTLTCHFPLGHLQLLLACPTYKKSSCQWNCDRACCSDEGERKGYQPSWQRELIFSPGNSPWSGPQCSDPHDLNSTTHPPADVFLPCHPAQPEFILLFNAYTVALISEASKLRVAPDCSLCLLPHPTATRRCLFHLQVCLLALSPCACQALTVFFFFLKIFNEFIYFRESARVGRGRG